MTLHACCEQPSQPDCACMGALCMHEQPFKLPLANAPAKVWRLWGMGCTGHGKEEDEEEDEGEEQVHSDSAIARRPSPACSSTPWGQEDGGTTTSGIDGADVRKEASRDVATQHHHGSINGSSSKSGGVIGTATAAPPASQPNVKVAVAGLWLSVRRSECFGLLVRMPMDCW